VWTDLSAPFMMGKMQAKTDLSPLTWVDVLQVRTWTRGGSIILAPRGEIDYGSVSALDQALERLPADTRGVVLDMTGVTFMDMAGLHFLQRLNDYGRRHGRPVTTANWRRQPRRLVELDRLSHWALPEASRA
jgi:anti-anti-sigma factor